MAADVELNPGPSTETQQILDAIHESNSRIELVRNDVLAMRADIVEVKDQMRSMKFKVESIEAKQFDMGSKLCELEAHINELSYKNDLVNMDLQEMALGYEKESELCQKLNKQVHFLKKESRKNN